ncbi:type II toxin-antitoxin system RelE/ParE family toxin [Dyadobacter sp. CY312]|uniref:type II toxin-antitoxin system RelE/ParE family toxin n=1 Tax=Dyadobacter sp. CY312 TaxID=2907303 RepID=UPI001F359665|nr:type II toxin-antitoxin system RelE/ParE family toxin [Dyadobacter sp. CY312]
MSTQIHSQGDDCGPAYVYNIKKYPSIGSDFRLFLKNLVDNSFQGDSLGKDCYKIRMAISSKNRGKSGGARVIACIKISDDRITLVSIYDKSVQSDIADKILTQLLKDHHLL